MFAPAPPLTATGGRTRLACGGSSLRRICRRPMRRDQSPIHRGALRARLPWRRGRRRAFPSICSPKVFRRPGSFARRRTATFSSPKAGQGVCSSFAAMGRAKRRSGAKCSPPVCRACSVSPSIRWAPSGGAHWTRDIAFSADGGTMFVSVGSATNDADNVRSPREADIASVPLGTTLGEERDRADVLAFDSDGGHQRVYATGLRNCSGLTVQPSTGDLWCAVNERDGLGDNLPPDYATRAAEGAFYGWPWYYIGAHEDPRHKGERPDLAGRVTVPDVLFQPHSAPLGIAFYEGDTFPAGVQGRRLRRLPRLVEPRQAHRLQGRAHPHEGRKADRRLRRLFDRLRRKR